MGTVDPPAVPDLRLHRWLTRLPWLRHSFKAKVLTIAFLGTHVPLLVILAYFICGNVVTQSYALQVLGVALAATLLGCLATLWALHVLLRPIDLTLAMLARFEQGELVRPRVALHDEMGRLIDGTARALDNLDAHLRHVASHDKTTGALNAHGLRQALNDCREALPEAVTLVQARLRNLTQMEVSLSRAEMAFVARIFVDRLRLLFPEPCRIAVIGRGQFAVLSTGENTEAALEARLDRALAGLTARMTIGASQSSPVCALGVAQANDSKSLDDVFAAAQTAVLAAEENEGSNWVLAARGGDERRTRMRLAFELDQAVRDGQLFAVYQPRVNARSAAVECVEALVRWAHPRRGVIGPGLFIPMAEHGDTILEIGRFMLEQAVAQAAAWQKTGRHTIVSVNVAAPQIAAALADDVRAVLARHALAPRRLELEITETALLASPADSVAPLQQLRDLGVTVALDDFGTGYSSLSYLSGLPVDRVKIDRSFVSRLDTPRDRQIVEGIVALCRALGLAVTAEGVETQAQAEALRAMGCDEWQGFFFAYPTASEDIDWQPRLSDPPAPRVENSGG